MLVFNALKKLIERTIVAPSGIFPVSTRSPRVCEVYVQGCMPQLKKKKKKVKDTTKPVLQGNGNIHSNSVFQSSVNSLETKQSPFLAILTYPCRTGGRNSNINQSFSLKSAVM